MMLETDPILVLQAPRHLHVYSQLTRATENVRSPVYILDTCQKAKLLNVRLNLEVSNHIRYE
jgi:hypothetical protein